jgi:hypothetical protein
MASTSPPRFFISAVIAPRSAARMAAASWAERGGLGGKGKEPVSTRSTVACKPACNRQPERHRKQATRRLHRAHSVTCFAVPASASSSRPSSAAPRGHGRFAAVP